MPTFDVEAMVRGYHAYQDSWDTLIGEELGCAREPDNRLRDPFAVAVVKSLGGTSLASAPCGSGSLHPAYCASSRLSTPTEPWSSTRDVRVVYEHEEIFFASGSGFAKFAKLKTCEINLSWCVKYPHAIAHPSFTGHYSPT